MSDSKEILHKINSLAKQISECETFRELIDLHRELKIIDLDDAKVALDAENFSIFMEIQEDITRIYLEYCRVSGELHELGDALFWISC